MAEITDRLGDLEEYAVDAGRGLTPLLQNLCTIESV